MNNSKHIEDYIEARSTYKILANKVEQIIKEVLEINNINFHMVTSRAKSIESFSEKIKKPKYDKPLEQLTDLAGIRIIGYVESDVNAISKLIEDIFLIDPENSLDKSNELGIDKVGYKSIHYVCQLEKSRTKLPEYSRFKELSFEIQIRTILQHSWAEIEHDKNYKFTGTLRKDIQRRFKLLAGLLESADREFDSISNEIDNYAKSVSENTVKGELDIPINSTSLKEFLKTKFAKAVSQKNISPHFNGKRGEKMILKELADYQIETLMNLNEIIPVNLESLIIKNKDRGNFLGLVRTIMMADNLDKYLSSSHKGNWAALDLQTKLILKELNIDTQKIIKHLNKKST